MSSPGTAPTANSEATATTGTERQILAGFLDQYREIIKRKVHGLTENQARARLVGSLTTLAGLLKHLAVAERSWFQRTLAGLTPEQIGANASGRSAESWQVADEETIADLIVEYDRACARSREIAADYELDHIVPHHRLGQVSLRWIYVHMIEETSRHAGHADILREQTDGSTST